jgi:uncharacterized protein (TIGR03437 family)
MCSIRVILLSTVVMFAAAVSARAQGDVPQAACSAPNAGFKILTFGSMNLGVWYPTAATPGPYSYNSVISGSVALNGPVSTCAKYPLVVFSHAYGGCGTQSVFLTEQLAREGYIVAAPDHADASCSVTSTTGPNPTISLTSTGGPSFIMPATWTNQSYINRYVDDENTINGMLAQPMFGPQIDSTRIAMSGHSLGGYDTFAMIGGWSTWLDTRVKCGLMLSPYIQAFLSQRPSTVPNASAPQMYQGGTLDVNTPYLMNPGDQYDQAPTPKIFVDFQGVGHLDFSDTICGNNSPTTVQTCLATVPNAANIDNYAVAFLNFYLSNQTVSLLWGTGQGLAALYWRDVPAGAASGASFLGGSVAPGEIVSLFGEGLSSSTAAASSTPLPATLGGATVTVTDSSGVARVAQQFFASPQQVNFLLPASTSFGNASVTVTIGGSVVASGKVSVNALAPSLFTANGTGSGLMNGYAQLSTGGNISYILPFNPNTLAPVPLNVNSGNVYLILAATGVDAGSAGNAQASIGQIPVPVASIGPYSPFLGVDAIALGPLPATLNGAGMQTVSIVVGGVPANPVSVLIQ